MGANCYNDRNALGEVEWFARSWRKALQQPALRSETKPLREALQGISRPRMPSAPFARLLIVSSEEPQRRLLRNRAKGRKNPTL
jgi:hypothetical protein